MLVCQEAEDTVVIAQPSHAWLSGQLARAWGNQCFGSVEPFEEVCLAAEQHDVGWDSRDLEPLLDETTGLPLSFMDMPLDIHLEVFTNGPRRMLTQSRYAALLISMHGHRLYARRDLERHSPQDAAAIRSFLAACESFQEALIQTLRADPVSARDAAEGVVQRNRRLIWAWDYISLALCLGWSPATAKGCPTAGGETDLVIDRAPGGAAHTIDPWPFAAPQVKLRCEARRLTGRFADPAALRGALETASAYTVQYTLQPG